MAATRQRMSRDDRRENLLQAACELFAEKGYDGTMLKDIAERAGVSKSLMPVYFQDKNEIYMQLYERWVEQEKLVVRFPIIEDSALKTLRHIVELFLHDPGAIYRLAGRDPVLNAAISSRFDAAELKLRGTREGSDLVRDSLLPIFEMGQASGELRSGDPMALAYLFRSAAVGLGGSYQSFPDRFYAPAADALVELFRNPDYPAE